MVSLMFDSLNDTVAAELRAAAARRSIPRAQVARNVGLPAMYVHRRFSAEVDISVGDLVRLCEGIGVEPLDVLAQVLTDLEAATGRAAEPAAAGS